MIPQKSIQPSTNNSLSSSNSSENMSSFDTLEKKIKIIGLDLFSGAFAACCVAPGIAIVDQAVTEKAADPTKQLFKSAFANLKSLFTQPRVFLTKPTFLFVCVVYGGTYMTANVISSLCEFQNKDPFYYKLTGTTAANMTLGILKDKYFAQVFSNKPVQKFPLSSWTLFVFRDSLTIAAGFNMPAIVAKAVHENQIIKDRDTALKVAQIGVPVSAQIFLTPIHLLALDFYNNMKATMGQRAKTVFSIYPESTAIRFCRVLCAYGIAGVANIGLRKELRERFVK